MKIQRVFAAVVACLLLAPLAACSSSEPESFNTIDELKMAYESAGGICDDWEEGDAVGAWAQFGNCGLEGSVLSTFSSEADLSETVSSLKSGKQSHTVAFVGPNWIITTNDDAEIGASMKATIVKLDSFE